MMRIEIPYAYEKYSFSPEATRRSKELAEKQARRKAGSKFLVLVPGIIISCFILVVPITNIAYKMSSAEVLIFGMIAMVVIVSLIWCLVYRAVTNSIDNRRSDRIDEALERDFKKVSLQDPEYIKHSQMMNRRRLSRQARQEKYLKNRMDKIFKK